MNFVWLGKPFGKPHTPASSPSNGNTWYFSASDQKSAVSSRTLSGYLSATSSACEKSSSRLYNSHLSLSGSHLPGANRESVSGSIFDGIRSSRQHASQPSLYMARFPKISKYCCVCFEGALASSKLERKLMPFIGICATPLTSFGCGRPAASRIVGAMSVQCVNGLRKPPLSLIRFGQAITIGLRIPPRCEATCLPHLNGVLPAHAHAAA